MEHFDIWKFLAGLGVFMFGILLMEESIKALAGKAFKSLIRKATKSRWSAISTGALATAVLQSSSAVTLMTLAFAGAGIMGMSNAIGVVIGSNVGTTFTAWIVATLGFKMNIESLSLPMLALGGIGLIFIKSEKIAAMSKLLVGFGFLFMGLDYMKGAVDGFASTINLAELPKYGIWFHTVIGFMLTAVMQSSSAAMAVILTGLDSKVISFNEAAAMAIGANIGTTVKIIVTSIRAVPIKKQVAASHFLFNAGTGLVAILIFPLFMRLFDFIFPDGYGDVVALAAFHTFFNGLGVLIFYPIIPPMSKFLARIFPDKSLENTRFIHNVSHDLPEAAARAVKDETLEMFRFAVFYVESILLIRGDADSFTSKSILHKWYSKEELGVDRNDYILKIRSTHEAIVKYATQIPQQEMERKDAERFHQVIYAASTLMQLTTLLNTLQSEWEVVNNTDNKGAIELYDSLRIRFKGYLKSFDVSFGNAEKSPKFQIDDFKKNLENDYHLYVAQVSGHLQQNVIKSKHASSLLTINGLLTQSCRQLANAGNPLFG
jgi:phosphate:Na+ symporter